MAQIGSIRPPDPHGAAGPKGIIATVNLRITYFAKSGAAIWGPVNLGTFWSSVTNTGNGLSDPRAIYDPGSGRFYVIMQENLTSQSFLNVAVSRNSNPTNSGASDWYFYRLQITESPGGVPTGGDYPGLGVDYQAVYVTYNMWTLPLTSSSSSFINSQIIILNKSALTNGTLTSISGSVDTTGFSVKPVSVLGGNAPGNIAYFVETPLSTTTGVKIWAVGTPLTSPVLNSTSVTVPNNGGAPCPDAPQSGTANRLDTLAPETQGNAFWYNGAVWFCHTAGGSAGRAIVYYYKVNLNHYPSGTPTLAESGGIDGGSGVWNFQPAIGGNAQGDVCLVFSQSSSSTFPTIMYTSRAAGAGSFETPTVLKASTNQYNGSLDGTNCSMVQLRWGDYATVAADPVDGSFWVCHEWAKTPANNNWSTWWGNISARTINNIIYVDLGSAWEYPDGSAAMPFPTVKQANAVAYNGNTIRIKNGHYPDAPISFAKQLRVESTNGPATIEGP